MRDVSFGKEVSPNDRYLPSCWLALSPSIFTYACICCCLHFTNSS